MPSPDAPRHPPLRSFGRIKSRAVKPRQAALFDSLLPSIRVPDPKAGPIDPLALMPGASEVWLEIGFGGGEHMAAQAARRPDALVLGCEPFVNGLASALRHVEEGGLTNVRLHPDDGRDVVAALPDASLDRVFILFPDPWHKARHNKRRLLQPAFLAELMRVLKPGGLLRFVTDWQDYADQSRDLLDAADGLTRVPDAGGDPEDRTAPADHVVTRYEEKKLGDCAPVFLDYVRG
ncbi:MAG: tRNA (guanosine(46)-N7)-methyltransferase TrmB [Alphaproteobacteria bacterium]|nr:tRNA (guanosine(46)-N7)-methyltransferase TrmB [Alphaproteobacteria bacterium]MBU1524961.1 tRNA (guanosine(46)-N7)-methyltransferase TrmB [Alphaproteobacteria bacterium]MBU2116893.1 tRNA (guanosine(46)-N7)-methyltransferase TrmB [Alphaproteobacteria bacterium]MBU2350321.1 tRNA (guanosine(46)-N7)-methyltransferase TrmB [Alphaproteobacteria bacterium]MBU2381794.1 tRNA (guanosine(46)-N7)-methyltransferase TrmB [Alphaproteobacteria bacterium]